MQEAGSRIPISHWQTMFEQAIAHMGDPDLPLKVAEQIQPKHLGVFGFAAMSSRTLKDVATLLLRYEKLVDDGNATQLVENGNQIELHWLPLLGPPSPIFMQQSLACWTVIARQLTACPTIRCDAHFSFKQPARLEIYQRVFGGGLFFGEPITKLVFNKSVLTLPVTQCDLTTHNMLMIQVEKTLQSLNQSDFLQKLREYISTHLASNQVSIRDVASAFGISVRNVQYQLSAQGIGYRHLLETIRQEHAEHYLNNTDISINEIAFLLGYSEQSPFQNAFRRWTGESPRRFRKSLM
jgi:AraC-like DNA-binding protein